MSLFDPSPIFAEASWARKLPEGRLSARDYRDRDLSVIILTPWSSSVEWEPMQIQLANEVACEELKMRRLTLMVGAVCVPLLINTGAFTQVSPTRIIPTTLYLMRPRRRLMANRSIS
jgi:hypothetical protein